VCDDDEIEDCKCCTRCGRSWDDVRLAKTNAGCGDDKLEAICTICVLGN
jgi:hypothetical protein